MVASLTSGAGDVFGLPVSTARALPSGVAGTMAASGAGLQWSTVRGEVVRLARVGERRDRGCHETDAV